MDFQQASSFSYVTLVDRAQTGGTEIIHDGVRIVFKPGETEKVVPQFVAEWLFHVDQGHVWTVDGQYVSRFAIKDISPELLGALGAEAGDTSPIHVDSGRIEGWDTSQVDRSNHRFIDINVPASAFRERQGVAAMTFGGRRE